ncbi:RelA/SpoT family protein [Lutibaculum baratangense]|uniref:GTP pyrophosphokinase rsh n=1 Tax=Lutibaculum baratangense AMV1 TaxID=631454 RepID=V4RCW0_9HYPH|nr:bifunctional (p)ppGpp synthetase/guanosine-3',5'-bis(diphosphate) 3'-pyrophosphohydrolase [Lutibaculum baratangense]ESR23234.1 GTP pyrophosphokinase, (p)ppGpp synthetase II [Lutibaculum baratangense AMV1]
MMRQYELVERVTAYDPDADENLLNRAYVYAMKAHGLQKRASGDPYFSHPLEVAAILTDLKLDDATIAAALLHDTIEDTDTTRDEIDRLFGKEIGALVDGLTKMKKLDLVSKRVEQAENLRKFMLAISKDVRVLLVKLADRLHNMRTLEYVPEAKRNRIAEETMDLYAPLAGRMGIQWMREELEELAFRQLQPEAYQMIVNRLAASREANAAAIAEIEVALKDKLGQQGIKAQVTGREKRPFSIFRKMEQKKLSFEQLSDIIGFRVVVDTVADCYQALGIVNTTWRMVPGRYKDYISTPKQNDYRSIHTTVIGPGHRRVELQIRTYGMNEVAEYGIAAHPLYKDGIEVKTGNRMAAESGAYRWLRRLMEMLAEGNTPEEFLEHTKLELFQDQVFCFTPKGRLIALPRGATAIDFAYAVHTDVGNTAIGSKINGRHAPLIGALSNGDEVEILTSPGQTPSAAWEGIAITGKARSAIRRATREATRRQYSGLGRQIVQRVFDRAGKPYSDERLGTCLRRLAQASVEDALAAVGRGDLPAGDVLKAVHPDYQEARHQHSSATGNEAGWFGIERAVGLKFHVPEESDGRANPIPIRGVQGDLPVKFSPEGGAVPGDRIVGIFTPGEGITIYPIQSPELQKFDEFPERWIDVRWDIDDEFPERFPAQIKIGARNEPGSLGRIAKIIGENDANIDNVKMVKRGEDFHDMVIDVEVWDVKHLNSIISLLKGDRVVNSVTRVNG